MASTKIQPVFDYEQLEIIDNLKGMGKNRTEKVKNIVIAWLSDQHYFKRNK